MLSKFSRRVIYSKRYLLRQADSEQLSIRDMYRSILERVSAYTRIPSSFMTGLKNCTHVLEVTFPLMRDDGTIEILQGFRAHHSNHSLPMKGGVRFMPNIQLNDVEGLAANNTMKMACLDIPYGGASGGVSVDPSALSENELQRVARSYARELQIFGFMGPALDVPGPDIGTNPRIMAWMMEEYLNLCPGDPEGQACITGKPAEIGGIRGRKEATGLGFYYALKEFLTDRSLLDLAGITPTLRGKVVLLQGFGNVGYHIAKFLTELEGAQVVGVLEWDGATYNPNGLDITELKAHHDLHGTVKGFNGGQTLARSEWLLQTECDIFVPAAVERSVNLENARKFKCKVVAEAGNFPVTPKAEQFLLNKGVVLLPDVILGAGGLVSSYFEYVKNIGHISPGKLTKRWDQKSNEAIMGYIAQLVGSTQLREDAGYDDITLLRSGLEDAMHTAVSATIKTSRRLAIAYKEAAYVNAMNKIYEHFRFSGMYSE